MEIAITPRADPRVVTLADVRPELVTFLWDGRLPAGKLVVIDGDPSTGKSTLTLDLAARVSAGRAWPDGAACDAGDVLLLSAEDGLADTIAPRLAAAGADRRRVHALLAVPRVDDDGTVRMVPPSLPGDIGTIRQTVLDHHVRLVIVDVLMAYLNGKVDSHRDQDVRGVLHQLADLAETTGSTILLIRHLNKAGGSNALYRGGGSIGIVGAARAAYLVARDPDDPDRRILACTKLNIAVEPPSLAYRLVDVPEYGCARVEWEEQPVDHTAASLLRPPEDEDDRSERDEAADWLRSYLEEHGGSAAAKDLFRAARADGIGERRLQRARPTAGVDSERRGFGQGSVWSVRDTLPAHSRRSRQDSESVGNGANGVGNGEQPRATPDPDAPSDDQAVLVAVSVSEPSTECRSCGQQSLTREQQARGVCGPCFLKTRWSA